MPDLKSFTILDCFNLLLMLAGGVVLVTAIVLHVRSNRKRDPLRGSPLRVNALSAGWVWLAMLAYFASGIIANVLASNYTAKASPADVKLWQDIITGNIHQLILIAAVLAIAAHTFAARLRGLGIGRQPFAQDIVAAVLVLLVSLCVCNLLGWATEALFRLVNPEFIIPEHPVFHAMRLPSTPLFIRLNALLGAALLAPIGEELLFRGILQTGFHKIFPPRGHSLYHRWAAIVCVATLFGLMHLSTPQHVPALIVLGVLLGYLYERTGSVLATIYLHILFNSKSLVWYFLGAG